MPIDLDAAARALAHREAAQEAKEAAAETRRLLVQLTAAVIAAPGLHFATLAFDEAYAVRMARSLLDEIDHPTPPRRP